MKLTNQQNPLPSSAWRLLEHRHRVELGGILDPWLEARSRQKKDPVLDFLFEYYSFRPSHLLRWSPGIGQAVKIDDGPPPEIPGIRRTGRRWHLSPADWTHRRTSSAEWTLALLKGTAERPPSFGCFGMHEWAMVYRTDRKRHDRLPLRMEPEELTRFVESRPLLCTHYDAFRFFTPKARPLNRFQPDRQQMSRMEQSGCLHTNMDLYKWSHKLWPWISSELIRKCFFLALEARRVDMQASPYNLQKYGLEPIRIEREEGRIEYLNLQKEIHRRSIPLRRKLIEELEGLLEQVEPETSTEG